MFEFKNNKLSQLTVRCDKTKSIKFKSVLFPVPLEPIKQDNELENEILNKDFLFSLPM